VEFRTGVLDLDDVMVALECLTGTVLDALAEHVRNACAGGVVVGLLQALDVTAFLHVVEVVTEAGASLDVASTGDEKLGAWLAANTGKGENRSSTELTAAAASLGAGRPGTVFTDGAVSRAGAVAARGSFTKGWAGLATVGRGAEDTAVLELEATAA